MTNEHNGGLDRRQTLKCMLWAGTGVVWTVAGGVPASRLIGSAKAAEGSFSFVQMSDCHIGFEKPANPDARATLNAAIDKVLAMPDKPAFMIHTGDISHTAKPQEFDDALQMIGRTKLDVHYAPGEHDILDPKTEAAYLDRFGKGATGDGWYSFDHGGVHFVSLVNVVDLKKNGLGSLGAKQLEWLEDDLKDKTASTPIVLFAHIPLWMIAPEWGWGTEDLAQALELPRPLRLGDGAQRPHPSADAEGRRERDVPYRALDRFSAARAGNRARARPKVVPAGELRKWLGVREVAYTVTPTHARRSPTAISPEALSMMRSVALLGLAACLAASRRLSGRRRRPRRAALPGLHGLPFAGQERRRAAPSRRIRAQGRLAARLRLFRRAQIGQYRLERGDARQVADRSSGRCARREDVLSSGQSAGPGRRDRLPEGTRQVRRAPAGRAG